MHSNINQVCTSYELVHTKGVAMIGRKIRFIKRVRTRDSNKRNRKKWNDRFITKSKDKEHYERILNDALKELYGDKND